MLKNYSFLIILLIIILIFKPDKAICKKPHDYQSIDEKSSSHSESSTDEVLSIRLKHDISLNELIKKNGYSIDDEDVLSFLADFSRLNERIKSISILKKGAVVKLPVKNLKKVVPNLTQLRKGSEKSAIKKKKSRKKVKSKPHIKVSRIDEAMILRNIKSMSYSLDEKIFIETEGFKFLTVNERSEISFDTSFFPIINLNTERIVVLDYKGLLPQEIKDIVEVSWPEYRVVINKGQFDLNNIIGDLLDAMGYAVHRNKKIIVGGRTQIEYAADFLVFRKDRGIMDSKMSIIGIIGIDEYATPENFVKWLKEKDINLIELSYSKTKRIHRGVAEFVHIDSNKDAKEFTETVLSMMGYKFSRDKVLNISDRKEYSFNLKADLTINLGYRTKIIEFIELSDYEIKYAKKRGFDVVCIKPWEKRKNIINQIMSLFSLNFKNSPRRNSSYITPIGVKYSLILPGFFMNSLNGPLFITDSNFEHELLGEIIDKKNKIITF